MESKEKVVMAVAGVAALGAVGFLAYKWSRNQNKKPGKKPQAVTPKGSLGKETQEDDGPDPDYEQAVKLKDEGNTAFKNGKYKEAIKLYTEAMKLSAKEIHFLLSNRSAAYLASGDLEHAQKDAEACIGVKPEWPKGYFRLGKVWAAKSDTKQAFTNYYKGFLLDPKSEELKKALETVSPDIKRQFGDLDSRSLVDNFLVKLFFEQQTDKAITEVLGADAVAFKAAIADFLKDADSQPQNLLSNAVIDPCIVKNEAETLLSISQIMLFEHSNADAAAFFSKKAYDLAPQNYRVLLNYASTILRQNKSDSNDGEQAFELIRKAFTINPDDVLLTHTYAFLILKKAQYPIPMSSIEVRSILKDLQKALLNPKTNHMLVADSGLRLWFKLFEDPDIQNQLLKEEEENQRRAIQPHRAYLNGLLKGAFNKLCLEPFFISCLSEVVLTNPGLEKVLSPFRTSFLFELKNLDDFNALKDLVFALGLQHFRNNYPIPPQDDEKDRLKEVTESLDALVSGNKAIVDDQLTPEFTHLLSIVALYEPLDQTSAAKVLSGFKNLSSLHPSLAKLIKKSVLDHEVEESLLNSLDRVGKIPEQPYIEYLNERLFSFWDTAGITAGKVTKTSFGKELKILFPKDENIKKHNDNKKLKVLVACCGSGLEVFQLANVYDNVEIYAFDPSEVHIAYAVRQNKELGNEAKFYVADLMSVSAQDFGVKGFDVVVANNILHHFPNPAQAFAKLCTFVNPGGFLKASVFSRSAIMQIAEVRKFLNGKFRKPFFDEKQEFPRLVRKPSVDQAREARWLLGDVEETSPVGEFIMHPMCQFFNEFTDIVFHPTIVGFGFDTVTSLLKKNVMDLVGFEFPGISQEAVLKYQTEHPDDLQLKNGKYLDQFDAKNRDELCPLTFSAHLTFFAQKPEDS